MTDQIAHRPLTDQQLDEIETRAGSLYEYATLTDQPLQADADQLTGEDVPALLAEVRRLRTELAEARANGIRYAAGLVTQAFHSEPFLVYPPDFADLLRDHADRLTAAARPGGAAVVSSAAETPGSAR